MLFLFEGSRFLFFNFPRQRLQSPTLNANNYTGYPIGIVTLIMAELRGKARITQVLTLSDEGIIFVASPPPFTEARPGRQEIYLIYS